MTKVTEITTRALRASGISDWGQPPETEDEAVAIAIYNEWMHSLPQHGVTIVHVDQKSSDEFPLEDRWLSCVINNLTVLLVSEKKKPVPPLIERKAREQFSLLRRAYRAEPGKPIDTALMRRQMPTTRARWRF